MRRKSLKLWSIKRLSTGMALLALFLLAVVAVGVLSGFGAIYGTAAEAQQDAHPNSRSYDERPFEVRYIYGPRRTILGYVLRDPRTGCEYLAGANGLGGGMASLTQVRGICEED